MHAYRVVSSFQPFPETIHVDGSHDIHFRNLHIYSDSKATFDTSVHDDDSRTENRTLEIAALDLPARSATAEPASSANVHRLATGFFNASSPALDPQGNLYFVDTVKQRIYRYRAGKETVEIVRDSPIEAANIFFDRAGDLLIVSYLGDGTVYSVRPDASPSELLLLKPQPKADHAGSAAFLPVDHWSFNASLKVDLDEPRPWAYVSPDGSVFLPAGNDFVKGALYYGTKMADVLRASLSRPPLPVNRSTFRTRAKTKPTPRTSAQTAL